MNTLLLEWVEISPPGSQNRSRSFSDADSTRNPGIFRIGRDPQRCDLVINNNTVSRQHIEIFWDNYQQGFYLRNLAANNIPVVDGQRITQGQVPLRQGSIVNLGEIALNVMSISIEPEVERTVVVAPPVRPQRQQTSQPQSGSNLPPVHQPPVNQGGGYHQHSYEQSVPGLECPNCRKVSDYSRLNIGCRWCGTSLGAAVSILVNPNRL